MYRVSHGLAPHFKTLLHTTLEKLKILSYSFDESLNELKLTYLSDFEIVLTNVSKCGIMVLPLLDMADTLSY